MIQRPAKSRTTAAKLTRRCLLRASASFLIMTHNSASKATSAWADGRLKARPGVAAQAWKAGPGTYDIRLGANRDGLFYVPPDLSEARPHPLIVMLHGGGDAARDVVPKLQPMADQLGIIVLAPESQASDSWDILEGAYGPDIEFIDHALEITFGRFTIDASRVALAGFSDGASYALSVGLMNGDLFGDVLAFSPGFAEPAQNIGKPRIFISHGDKDTVLPVESGGRRLAKELGEAGYDVDYREFDGGHIVPPDLVAAATKRFSDEELP
jgi:phospholipase/carboxylesterase